MTTTTAPSIVLKSIHNAILSANPNSTLTTKQMRAKLRALRKFDHVRNASWLFTQQTADECRALFDPAFAETLARRNKRNAKPKRQRAAKPAPVAADASTDA